MWQMMALKLCLIVWMRRQMPNRSIELFILKQNRMSQLSRVVKKGVKEQGPEDSRREYNDHDIFSLEYLNNTMNYLLPGKNDLNHSYRLNSDVLEQIIYDDVTNLGIIFPERVKQMKPVCSAGFYAKDLQEYGDFINYELPRARQRQMQSIERQLKRQVEFHMAVKRLKRRYPFISENISLMQGQKLIIRMKNEILQSLISENEIIDSNLQQQQLEKNKLYRELFNLADQIVIQQSIQNHKVFEAISAKQQHNQNNIFESTGQPKTRKGRRPKKALQEKDLDYRPTLTQKFVKKNKIIRSGENSEKPSRLDQQSENFAEDIAVRKQLELNSRNVLFQQKKPQETPQGQLKMQIQGDNKDVINLNVIDKQKNQEQAMYVPIEPTQKDFKAQFTVVKKRRPRIIKEKISGQSQTEKKSQKSQKVIKKRNYKKNIPTIDIPITFTNAPKPPRPDVAEIGIQANPECLYQDAQNNRILIPKYSSPIPNPPMQIKKIDLIQMQQQQPKVDLQQIKAKELKKKLQQTQPKSEIQQRQHTGRPQPKTEQKGGIPNLDDFIDQCLN